MTNPKQRPLFTLTDRKAVLILMGLVLLFFWPLLARPTGVLYSPWSDLLAEHIPAKRFLLRSYQTHGEIPLWCPLQFAGSPFVHDPQVAIFYPLHLPLLLLGEEHVGIALSWLTVLHLMLAAGLTYLYARSSNMTRFGSLITAVGYTFGTRWMGHLVGGGQYITAGLAWMPLVLLCLEKAIQQNHVFPTRTQRGGFLWATLAGISYALIVLSTHPQWTFYAGLMIALWTMATVVTPTRASILRWLGYGIWTVTLAVLLSAIQLMPTLEAAGQTIRTVGGMAPQQVGASLQTWAFLIGPTLLDWPNFFRWEDRGGQALLWLLCAISAPLLMRGRIRAQAGVCLFLMLLGGGGSALLSSVPGFNLFRQSPRIWIIAGFPIAVLAGRFSELLFCTGMEQSQRQRLTRTWWIMGGIALIITAIPVMVLVGQGRQIPTHVYWFLVPLLFGGAVWVLRQKRLTRPEWKLIWILLLLADLWTISWAFAEVRYEKDIFKPPECVVVLEQQQERGRVWDGISFTERGRLGTPLGEGVPLGMIHNLECVRGYNPLDKYRYRTYLQLIAGSDKPLKALGNDFTWPVIGEMPPRNRSLINLLNVRYFLVPENLAPRGSGWTKLGEDPAPVAFNSNIGGRLELPPHGIYRNDQALPRAFMVYDAKQFSPDRDLLKTMTAPDLDFSKTVLLETPVSQAIPQSDKGTGSSEITRYEPNHVEIRVTTDAPGYLVLVDSWFPGWTCSIDGKPVPIHKANYAFRAVEVPGGTHHVRFDFRPKSYVRGRWISEITALTTGIFLFAILLNGWIRRRREGITSSEPIVGN